MLHTVDSFRGTTQRNFLQYTTLIFGGGEKQGWEHRKMYNLIKNKKIKVIILFKKDDFEMSLK